MHLLVQYNVLHKEVIFMAFSIRLTDEERKRAESYAKMHAYSLSEAFKRAWFEKIEDDYDIAVAEEAYNEYVADGRTSRPADDGSGARGGPDRLLRSEPTPAHLERPGGAEDVL